jgi:hypothetical protein
VWKIFAFWVLVLLAAAPASAEPVRRVLYNGIAMSVTWNEDDTHLEVAYPDPLPAELAGQSIPAGALLLEGSWNRNAEILEGQAFAYFEGCPPRPYAVRGVVERGGSLVVLGPAPENCTGGLAWASGGVLRLAPMMPAEPQQSQQKTRKTVKRERKQPEVKRERQAYRPRREREPRVQQQYQYPSFGYRWW